MHTLRRCHATQCGVKYCAPGAGGLPSNYLLNLVLNLTLNVLDLGKLVFRGSPFDSCCNQLYRAVQFCSFPDSEGSGALQVSVWCEADSGRGRGRGTETEWWS